jgi:hypothetical protein
MYIDKLPARKVQNISNAGEFYFHHKAGLFKKTDKHPRSLIYPK